MNLADPVKTCFLSLGVGLLVGIIYGLLNVKSPAPPVVALVGLLGILGGEQAVRCMQGWRASRQASRTPAVVLKADHPVTVLTEQTPRRP